MEQALVPTQDAIDRVVASFRSRLESALANGQRVRMTARERASTQRAIPADVFARVPLAELLTTVESDGSYELHVYIEPRPR
jgi:hypothetical protein